jgi:hypothetical protein
MNFPITKSSSGRAKRWLALLISAAMWLPTFVSAFPPAPHHRVYGLVRDEYGTPLAMTGAQIMIETSNGANVAGIIVPGLAPGSNYELDVSMDSGIASDVYKATALKPSAAFRMRVKIGVKTYLPIEMAGNFASLGNPAQATRIDLTIGEDLDGDGLPDAWQRLLRTMLGPSARTGPNDDADSDGISNLNEYLAGTYAFDPQNGFRLSFVTDATGAAALEFMTIKSRTYTLLASTDATAWTPIRFKLPSDSATVLSRAEYRATDIKILRVIPLLPDQTPASKYFFQVQVQ